MNIKNKHKNNKLKIGIIASILVVILVGGTAALLKVSTQDNKQEVADKQVEASKHSSDGINYAPPTAADEEMNREQEARNKERERLDQLPPSSNAEVFVSGAGQYDSIVEVRAYVSNIYEDGGSCTAQFTKDGAPTVKVTKTAVKDAKTIQCGALDTERSKFSTSGKWTLSVSYESANASGKSSNQIVEIK